jgi:hypothetical protein
MLTPDAEEEAWEKSDEAIDALRAALAQQQAEPMGGEVERLMCVLSIQDATIKALSAALQQAEPVSAPPKSFRVGYMTGYADGQRELREKQQAEQKHVFNQAKGGYSNGKPAPTNQRVSGVVAGRDRCDERDQGERGRTGRNGGEVAVTGRTRPAMDQHRSDGSSAGAYGAHEGGGKTYNVLKQQTGSVQAEPVVWVWDYVEPQQAEPVVEPVLAAVLAEREACAQLCAHYTEWCLQWGQDSNHTAAEAAANECAFAILARGQQAEPVVVQAEPVADSGNPSF